MVVEGKVVTAERCLHEVLGDRIDILWRQKEGVMELSPSSTLELRH